MSPVEANAMIEVGQRGLQWARPALGFIGRIKGRQGLCEE